MFATKNITKFFQTALAGESATYDDHNWYTSSGLRGYIKGRSSNRYPLLKKDLSDYTIKEIMSFQNNPRNSNGQLWATGRYQIIPNTLKGLVAKTGINTNKKYNKTNQDILGMALLQERSSIWKYLTGEIPDNKKNLESASLSMSQIWSSIGVPYGMKARYGWIDKNQSYYSGGGDKAHVSTEAVQSALKKLRKTYGIFEEIKKKTLLIVLSLVAFAGLTFGAVYMALSLKKK